jgi:phosphodiesterase/alkaline phosphatase D-like protein
MKTDQELLEANAHISDAQIWQDIHETQNEITVRLRLNYDAEGVAERQEFIAKLQKLLALRGEK